MWSRRCVYPRECARAWRGFSKSWGESGDALGIPPRSAGQDRDQGGSLAPAGGAWELRAAASVVAGSSPVTAKLERLRPGWGSVGKSVGAARELTVSGDVVVPGRMARGPRGAAELQEKCQIVEGAERRGQRGPHATRSGRGGAAASHRGSAACRTRSSRVLPGAAAALSRWPRPGPGCRQRAHAQPAASDCGTLRLRGRPLRAAAHPPSPSLPALSRRRRRDPQLDLSSKFCPGWDF